MSPFSSHIIECTLRPRSHAASLALSKPKSRVSIITSRKVTSASVGIVAWYMKPPASYDSISSSHLRRSHTNDDDRVARATSAARSFIITRPAHDGPVHLRGGDGRRDGVRHANNCAGNCAPNYGREAHPFCGAEMRASTPSFFMSTHTVPDAMQSRTMMPPTECIASATFLM